LMPGDSRRCDGSRLEVRRTLHSVNATGRSLLRSAVAGALAEELASLLKDLDLGIGKVAR
jgi:hypothetical protein